MDPLSLDDRRLGILLGLGDLAEREVCHGYSNACPCSACLEREESKPKQKVIQPWIPKHRAA